MRIFLSCAAASCSEEPSIGLLIRSEWDTSTRSGCKTTNTYRAIVVIWEVKSRCSYAGHRHAAEVQTRVGHGSLNCNFHRSWMSFTRSDEIRLRTWLCAAVRAPLNFGHTECKMGQGFFVPGQKRRSADLAC
jgi:hypothetical protein